MTAEPRPGDADDWVRLHRAHWDERAPIHTRSDHYDVEGFVAGREHLRAPSAAAVFARVP